MFVVTIVMLYFHQIFLAEGFGISSPEINISNVEYSLLWRLRRKLEDDLEDYNRRGPLLVGRNIFSEYVRYQAV